MIRKKICMLGSFAVGKTSMVRQFVSGIFSEKYLTTVGVKIDKKILDVSGHSVTLMLWDLAGEDQFHEVESSYLRGASGYLLVADGTRRNTLESAYEIQKRVERELGPVPFVLAINKADLEVEREIESDDLQKVDDLGWSVVETSARTGQGVEEVFSKLAEAMLDRGAS